MTRSVERQRPESFGDPVRRLFRSEATEAHADRLWGEVILVQPVSTRILTYVCLAIALVLSTFSVWARYPRTASVAGYLAPDSGVSKLYPQRAGTVSEVLVQVGDAVEDGAILLRVDSGVTLGDGGNLEQAQRQQLLVQRSELLAKIDAQARLLELRQQRASGEIGVLEKQIGQLAALLDVVAERRDIAEGRRAKLAELLRRGASTEREYEAQRDVVLAARAELLSLEREQLTAVDALARVRAEVAAAPLEHRERDADLRLQLAENEGRLSDVESRSSYAVKSPRSGIVAALQVAPGTRVSPAAPVAVIRPQGGRIEANLLVPTRAVGMIEVGQTVGVKYAAFPHERFGIQRGRIKRLETTILNPDEVQAPIPIEEPMYRALVALDAESIAVADRSYPLQPGMLLQAEIVLERRSVLQWILRPLLGLRKVGG